MENLTFAQKLIKPHSVDPLEGHTVVVFETVGETGDQFRFEIEPGMRAPRTGLDLFKWLRGGRGGASYFAYAVTSDPELRFQFITPVRMDSQAHTFSLVTTLAYSISEPRLLVTRRNDDPLRKLRDEVGARLRHELAARSWISVRSEFRELAEEVVATVLEPLRHFAGRYGFAIGGLSLACELDEQDFAASRHEAKIEQQFDIHRLDASLERVKIAEESKTTALRNEELHQERLREVQREHEVRRLEQLQTLNRAEIEIAVNKLSNQRRIGSAVADAAANAIATAGGAIRTPAELLQAFTAFQGAVGQMRALADGSATLPAASGALALLGGSQGGAAAIVADMFARTEQMPSSIQRKRELQSAILHLIGELLLEGGAAAATVEEYRGKVEDLRSQGGLPIEQVDYLKKFSDADRLRSEMQ